MDPTSTIKRRGEDCIPSFRVGIRWKFTGYNGIHESELLQAWRNGLGGLTDVEAKYLSLLRMLYPLGIAGKRYLMIVMLCDSFVIYASQVSIL